VGAVAGITAGAVAGIVVAAVIAALLAFWLSKKGYDYYQVRWFFLRFFFC
jgi:tetrahydromethanopterin S-methyltransferase subunit B